MISFETALKQILDSVQPLPVTVAKLSEIYGCVLAKKVVATHDMPQFDNSAVDGFGVRVGDVASASLQAPKKLSLVGTIRAGDAPPVGLKAGKTLKILTGAPVPHGVEAVVMKEYCEERNGHVYLKAGAAHGDNIRRRGGECLRGRELLDAGVRATPPVVGLLASLGHDSFPVYKMPRVSVVSTGDELVKPGRRLAPGQIYDSNSYALEAAVRSTGIKECFRYHASEDKTSTKRILSRALNAADLVISAGGVSVGDYDCVKEVLEELGVSTQLWRIAMKPGKPVYFGILAGHGKARSKYVFGLPGNPVSALVTFHQLVKPALEKMIGLTTAANDSSFRAQLKKQLSKKAGRLEFVRGTAALCDGNWTVSPTSGQDSHMLSGLACANALIRFPLQAEQLSEDEPVSIDLLDW